MAEVSDARLGTMLEGRYRLDQRLAAGGMGVVYKGELTAIGKPVAIKFLHDALTAIPDLVKRFQREAVAMSRLAHPHLVSVVDSGVTGGVPFLVMDFVSGRTLAEVLAGGPLPGPRAVGLTRQILAGVKHAHASGVVHRDLKPDNILLLSDVEEDFVKILDFGLAKVVAGENESAGTQLTNTGFAMGTPGYMSPEQARGVDADERSDLYAVGVILFHMVTGRKPFVADSPLAVLRMHMDDAPPSPNAIKARSCSPELERVILRAMAKEPRARWQTAADFARALAETPEAVAAGSQPAVDDEGSQPRRRRRPIPWLWIGRGVAALAVCIVVGWGWRQLSRRQQQNVRRHLNEAVKMAEGAYESMRKPGEEGPPGSGKPNVPPPAPPGRGKPGPSAPVVASAPPQQQQRPGSPMIPPPEPPQQRAAPPPFAEPPSSQEPQQQAEPAPIPPTTAPAGSTAEAPLPDDDDADDDDSTEEPVLPRDTPGARLEEGAAGAPQPAAGPTTREAVVRLLMAGRTDQAIQILYAARKRSPRNAEVPLLLGHAYFRKGWRTDGLREYNTAMKMSPALRRNGVLVRNTVASLEYGQTYRLARAVIRVRIGAPAIGEVRRLARTSRSKALRIRASRLAQQLARSARRR